RPNPLAYVPLLFVCNIFFFQGYVNYTLAVGLLFAGLGYLIRTSDEREPDAIFVAALSLLLFFSHLLAFIAWIAALGFFLLCRFTFSRLVRTSAAVLPSFVLLAWYTLHRLAAHDVGVQFGLGSESERRLIDAAKVMSVFTMTDWTSLPDWQLVTMGSLNLL